MSEQSYMDNVRGGHTGPWSATCLLASYDRLSENCGISPETYRQYDAIRRGFALHVGDNNNFVLEEYKQHFRNIKAKFRAELGVYTPKNVFEARVNTQDELVATIGKLSVGGFRTALYLDVGGLHAVGVKKISDDEYEVRSTWSPFSDDEPVSADTLYGRLDLAPRQRNRPGNCRKTFPAFNLIALPPERK